jgi:hypothetical protein
MKSIAILLILLVSQLTTSQTYILDSTFGNNGQIQYLTTLNIPSKVILSNNNYYYLSDNKITKTNYSGQFQNSFGVNGVMTLPSLPSNQYLQFTKLIYSNNAFYVYGNVSYSTNGISNDDCIIYKFDENGNMDSTFGTNGVARIDLGEKESLSSIIIKTDGSIYCGGTRSDKMIYFKLTSLGVVDYTFDTNGYKTITNFPVSYFGYLVPDENGKYILVGMYRDTNAYGILITTKVNENGDVDTFFGNNGYLSYQVAGGIGSHALYDAQFYQNKLYIQHFHAFSQYSYSTNLKIIDLTTEQSIYDESLGTNFDFAIKSDGVYIAENNYCVQTCTGSFKLSKRNLDGVLNTTFHNNGLFTYDFPNESGVGFPVYSILRCLQVSDSGEILLSGFSSAVNGLERKFASIRILQGALGLSEINSSDVSIQPNPFNTHVSIKTQGKISDLKVYSLNGSEIYQPEIKNLDGLMTIDLTSIKSSGVYILKFYSDNTQVIKKLIKY